MQKVKKPTDFKVKVKVALAQRETPMVRFAEELFPELEPRKAKAKFFNLLHNNRWIDEDLLNQIRVKLTLTF